MLSNKMQSRRLRRAVRWCGSPSFIVSLNMCVCSHRQLNNGQEMKYMWTAGQDVSTYIGTRTLSVCTRHAWVSSADIQWHERPNGEGISSGVVWYSVQCNQINIPSPEIHLTTVFILAN